nr:MAG TPA: hypothetical protein [Caudoviricetes sp.]
MYIIMLINKKLRVRRTPEYVPNHSGISQLK